MDGWLRLPLPSMIRVVDVGDIKYLPGYVWVISADPDDWFADCVEWIDVERVRSS